MNIFKHPQSTNFSIVFPSLRWEWIRMVLNSILDNALYPNKIDIHIGINIGDEGIKSILTKYQLIHQQIYFYEIDPKTMIFANQKTISGVAYTNTLTFEYTMGKYIMPMNDDALFISKNWDINCWNILENFEINNPDGIMLGITKDNIGARGFNGSHAPASCFPFISRKGIEYFGYLFSPEFYHNTADTHITYVYYNMKRTVDLKNVLEIQHRPPELCNNIAKEVKEELDKC